MIVRITLYALAALIMAAHFLRGGSLIGVALCLMIPMLFLVRRRWSLLLLQWLAYAAAIIWLGTAWEIVAERRLFGQPWLLALAILVTVAAVSALAGGLLSSRSLQERYRD